MIPGDPWHSNLKRLRSLLRVRRRNVRMPKMLGRTS